MAIKKYLRRRKKRKPEANSQPFFQSESAQHDMPEGNSFFLPAEGKLQAKMAVSQPGDKQEQEADHMADKVVHKKVAEEKMPPAAKKEEEKISKKDEEDEIHKKPEEEKLSKKANHLEQKQFREDDTHDHDQRENPLIATKGEGGGQAAKAAPVSGHQLRADHGTTLPHASANEMSSSFGYDFSNVKIHTDKEAQQLSRQLNAQAFTYGGEIYFNENKYNPQSTEGRWLLAHELTHVVQQKSNTLQPVQRKTVPGISTPVPEHFTVKKKEQVIVAVEGEIKGAKVLIKPDQTGEVAAGKSGQTYVALSHHITAPFIKDGKILTAGKASVTLIIQTTFKDGVNPADPSKYGRGTTADDKQAGNTSLRFHEGTHGTSAMDYVVAHVLPVFEGKAGDTGAAYDQKVEKYAAALEIYKNNMIAANVQAGDCSGNPEPGCAP